eukprot:CAMPEP_0170515492 /NCGR_PEP_ID=MMETSP0209-20121228/1918_1 /TAXON_ID=665100 ORGANISM="Litonotus pictus, Strain P1" /NCGR_SAMPLE_ID=MMETSP0209 /ASSEMBLY_ACC=CAM_ASM_000301 /LENGTH=201 /DNA_ID=CAMNT_0010800003 /DNA_START=34 /DNA_END=639 /DNA_ORIENTATION=-
MMILVSLSFPSIAVSADCDSPETCYIQSKNRFDSSKESMNQEHSKYINKLKELEAKSVEVSEVAMFKEYFPVGHIYISGNNQQPPLQGKEGVKWELLNEGYGLMTGNAANVGKTTNGIRLDNGSVAAAVLTIAQMAAHNHAQGGGKEFPVNGSAGNTAWRCHSAKNGRGRLANTYPTGNGKAHSHTLDTFNTKLNLWKRIA